MAVAVTGAIAVSSVGGLASAHAGDGSVTDGSAPQADLSISTRPSTSGPYVDRSFNWLLSVTNSGLDAAQSVVVSDVVPASMTVINVTSDAFQCSTSANTVSCTRSELAAGASGAIDIDVMLPPATSPSTVQNSAAVTSATSDPNPSNNSAGASVQTVVVQVGAPDVVVPDVVVPAVAVSAVAVRSDLAVPVVVADVAGPAVAEVAAVPNVHPTRTPSPSASTHAVSQSATSRPSTPSALPTTGTPAEASTMIALTMLLAGSALLVLRRRRLLGA